MRISTINTIELSSKCNNSCRYCPAPAQHKYRETGFMSRETFELAIDNVLRLCREGTQREVNLFGVGESTLHPDLVQCVEYARRKLPFKQHLHLNTNGVHMTEELAKSLKDAGINQIDITGHDPYYTARTIRIFRKLLIPHMVSFDFVVHPNNWAGQVDWFEPDEHYPKSPCPWLVRGQIVVMSSGDLTTCCIDAFGSGTFGTISDDLTELSVEEHDLCRQCHHITPKALVEEQGTTVIAVA